MTPRKMFVRLPGGQREPVELIGDEVVLPKSVRIVGVGASPRVRRASGSGITSRLAVKPGAQEAYLPTVALQRAVDALGNNAVADLLGVSKSQPGRWLRGAEGMAPANASAVLELDALLGCALQTFTPEQTALWLTGADPHLGGARPIDAFRRLGLQAVLPALAAHEQGALA
ncbi:MAG: hypothetical protein M3P96_07585 [Actinomycetota bacterium]|nr:hypothetical protein [Actinomycetota bacterium]